MNKIMFTFLSFHNNIQSKYFTVIVIKIWALADKTRCTLPTQQEK